MRHGDGGLAPADAAAVGLAHEDGLRAAYAAHGGELYRFALRALGSSPAAEDVVQETFVRAWRAADSFDHTRGNVRGWLFAIARNRVIDHRRADAVRPWDSAAVPLDTERHSLPADDVDQALEAWVVEEALAQLSPEHRDAIVQTHLHGRPHHEVASELDIPLGTLRSRIFYGLKSLRVALDEIGVRP